ncbi:hypothetical protein M501DRAFT_1015758 [Patellaria atrata CBS 101060]|uniref:Uncharacterized protein n=1 Tax=Patellaria atrata CBS 101060 TaxID=1346257 RepID=A0A9P4SBL6_9PEZI|nr:hypothetical protein M501DRAFT_1015758 [Patellaria atrata CBS 101060]
MDYGTKSVVTWAVPVKIETLGPHLEAYVESRPAIHALRACYRFGQGPDVYVNRLPVELLLLVEEEILTSYRDKAKSLWNKDFQCWKDDCTPMEHLSDGELREVREDCYTMMCSEESYEKRETREKNELLPAFAFSEEIEDAMAEYVADSEMWCWEHNERKDAWCSRVDYWFSRNTSLETKRKKDALPDRASGFETLRRDFGLHPFFSHQVCSNNYEATVQSPRFTFTPGSNGNTMIYLIIPNDIASEQLEGTPEFAFHLDFDRIDSMLSSIIDPSALILTPNKAARFWRAMNVLGLKPYVDETQLRAEISRTKIVQGKHQKLLHRNPPNRIFLRMEEEQARRELEKSEWPKLMNLVASTRLHIYDD